MLELTIGTNTSRKKVIVDPSTKLRDVLEANGVNLSVGTVNIDGIPVRIGDLDRTLADLGITEKAYIISVAKADNAK